MAENTHNTKIVISGDASGATGALSGVRDLLGKGVVGALNGVRSAISRVMQAFGLFGLAMQGVEYIITGYKKLTEYINRANRAWVELKAKSAFDSAAESMDKLIRRQELYNTLLKDELSDLSRRKELQSIEKTGNDRRKDEQREIARAKELAAAQTPEEERKLRQKWAVEDETRQRGNLYRQLKSNVAEETEKSSIYGSKADASESNVKAANEAIAKIRSNFVYMTDEQLKEADKQIAALQAKRKAAAADAEQYRLEEKQAEKRAELYRRQIEDVRNGGGLAQARNAAENAKLAREAAEKNEKEQKTRDQNLEDRKLARQKEEALAELDPSSPDYERQKKEVERTYEILAAEDKERRAENDTDRKAAEEERQEIDIRHERERAEERVSLASGMAERTASFDGVSQNRLTAMGLGSGVSATGGVAGDVKKLVDLLKQQVEESKKLNEKDYTSGPSTYAE